VAELSHEFRRLSDDSVRRRTGKGWSDWRAILDEWGAAGMELDESATHLVDAYGLSPWWARAVATRYELDHGARESFDARGGRV
jgi:Domain of unknown function (DUF4287)